MIKKIVIISIFIYLILAMPLYATDEILSSQMDTLNISSFVKEGEKYTKNVFPDIDINSLLNSSLKGEIDNGKIFKNFLSLIVNEVISTASFIGNILIVIIIHSLLKTFSENLNKNKGIGQIAYYVEYILVVTIIMTNFTNIISVIKDSISNLIGFVNSLIPILLALMSATRKCYFCYTNRAITNICNYFYWKWNYFIYNSILPNNYSYWHNIKSIRSNTNK